MNILILIVNFIADIIIFTTETLGNNSENPFAIYINNTPK